jgi:hypothetical protein
MQSRLSIWPPAKASLPPERWSGRGRPSSRVRRDADHAPVSARERAGNLPEPDWKRSVAHPPEWLLIERPECEKEPAKCRFLPLPEDIAIEVRVDTAKLRWLGQTISKVDREIAVFGNKSKTSGER